MGRTSSLPLTVVAQRVVARAVHHLIRDPIVLLGLTLLVALTVAGGIGPTSESTSPGTLAPEDAADLYMRGLLNRDVESVFASLSPELRRSFEQRTGLVGPAAVAAFFHEQERRGERTVGYRHVASYTTAQGEELRFYVVQTRRGDQQREIPYVLTLNADGTIAKIE